MSISINSGSYISPISCHLPRVFFFPDLLHPKCPFSNPTSSSAITNVSFHICTTCPRHIKHHPITLHLARSAREYDHVQDGNGSHAQRRQANRSAAAVHARRNPAWQVLVVLRSDAMHMHTMTSHASLRRRTGPLGELRTFSCIDCLHMLRHSYIVSCILYLSVSRICC